MKEIMSSTNIVQLIKGYALGKDYLEVGVYRGAMLQHAGSVAKTATGIDNFSLFDAQGENEKAAKEKITGMENTRLIVGDCYAEATKKQVEDKSIDVFFYDAGHTAEETEKGILGYAYKLRDRAVIIVDDWNHEPAREGTYKAIEILRFAGLHAVKLAIEHFTTKNADADWWNGIAVFHVERNSLY